MVVLMLVWFVLVSLSGSVMLLNIVCDDSRLKCWKIMLILWCVLCSVLVDSSIRLCLLMMILFLFGCVSRLMVCMSVFLLVLFWLMMLNILFCGIVRLMLCSVLI